MPKTKVAKRVLEAEKVIVANILYRWKRDYGMDYMLIVKNSERSFYAHSHISTKSLSRMDKLAKQSLKVRP